MAHRALEALVADPQNLDLIITVVIEHLNPLHGMPLRAAANRIDREVVHLAFARANRELNVNLPDPATNDAERRSRTSSQPPPGSEHGSRHSNRAATRPPTVDNAPDDDDSIGDEDVRGTSYAPSSTHEYASDAESEEDQQQNEPDEDEDDDVTIPSQAAPQDHQSLPSNGSRPQRPQRPQDQRAPGPPAQANLDDTLDQRQSESVVRKFNVNLLNPNKRVTAEHMLEVVAHALREANVTAKQTDHALEVVARLFSKDMIKSNRSLSDEINNAHIFLDAAAHRHRNGEDEHISAIREVNDLWHATLEESTFTTARRPNDLTSMVFKDRLAVRYGATLNALTDPLNATAFAEEAAEARNVLGMSRRHGDVNDALSIIIAQVVRAQPNADVRALSTNIKNKIKLGQSLAVLRSSLSEGVWAAIMGWKWSTVLAKLNGDYLQIAIDAMLAASSGMRTLYVPLAQSIVQPLTRNERPSFELRYHSYPDRLLDSKGALTLAELFRVAVKDRLDPAHTPRDNEEVTGAETLMGHVTNRFTDFDLGIPNTGDNDVDMAEGDDDAEGQTFQDREDRMDGE